MRAEIAAKESDSPLPPGPLMSDRLAVNGTIPSAIDAWRIESGQAHRRLRPDRERHAPDEDLAHDALVSGHRSEWAN